MQLLRGQAARQLGVDRFNSCSYYGRGGAAAFCDLDEHTAPVVGIDLAFEIAAEHQRVNQLPRGLLGNSESADKVAGGTSLVDHASEDERSIARHVVESRRGEAAADLLSVGSPRGSQERRKNDVTGRDW